MKTKIRFVWLRRILGLCLAMWLVVSPLFQEVVKTAETSPYSVHGRLSVQGTQLVDKNGTAFQIQGVSTHGLAWYPAYVNKEAFRTMRDEWGVNTVRLAMYTAEYGGYCETDENGRTQLKELVLKGVQAASDLGMYVIVDWHVLNDQDPNRYKSMALDFFREMAPKLQDYGNVIYEICNEPNGGVTWDGIRSYAVDVIDVIRQSAPDSVIIVGTPTWSQDVDIAADHPIERKNLLYALHFYAATHTEYYRTKAVNAINKGLPLIVSEFGICDASGNGGINTYEADKWMELLDQYGIGYAIWNLSNKNETSALIRSDCSALSGWTRSQLSASGQWFVDRQAKNRPAPADVTGLKATGGIGNQVRLTWNAVSGADGYLIYGKRGSNAYGYIGMTTSAASYTDNQASSTQSTCYWVYAFSYRADGTRAVGGCAKSAAAKSIGKPAALSGLKAQSLGDAVKLTWNAVSGADGYLIYGRRGSNAYGYIGMAASNSYLDRNALSGQNTYYWVYPYYLQPGGGRIVGTCPSNTYGRKIGTLAAVTGVKAQAQKGSVKLEWKPVPGAAGYLIYGRRGTGAYGYIGMSTTAAFEDKKAPADRTTYYWVYAFCKKADGSNLIGEQGNYISGRSL